MIQVSVSVNALLLFIAILFSAVFMYGDPSHDIFTGPINSDVIN